MPSLRDIFSSGEIDEESFRYGARNVGEGARKDWAGVKRSGESMEDTDGV